MELISFTHKELKTIGRDLELLIYYLVKNLKRIQNAGNCVRTQAFLCTSLEIQIGFTFVVSSLATSTKALNAHF